MSQVVEAEHNRIDYKALVVAYAMSRLDRRYLEARGHSSWASGFNEAAAVLELPRSSLKNLRDEFDPFHENERRGWHQRPMRPSRQRVMADLDGLSEDALIDFVQCILSNQGDQIEEVLQVLASPPTVVHNVAERLRTGRLAEEYFIAHCSRILHMPADELIDRRHGACGFDFGLRSRPEIAIETKGLRTNQGSVLFTDREWTEARSRRDDYLLVVVGNLDREPGYRIFANPCQILEARCRHQATISATWSAKVALDG